jgi:uncharacterized protein with GYD domain
MVEEYAGQLATSTMKMAALGNVRTQPLRGFTPAEMCKLVAGLP